ncbi:hypothetical protein DIZ81_03735 [Legionella taurinensis]|uniref:PPM-type phosphatase domain-containing protein n=2 Tax=Legionella taurinensis TaxID=70611 RepID=A0AB38N947_9GAMM|nr:hypothetical protein [Legionella taurinensis]MDX1836777.1 hypothetical protein [Legionella taurinensis]PUT41198.1 hypothetical protein DB744_03735 [Legionella taurinensis]PUT42323.1 hypothetical protein DB746_07665 [Legionella taurinensis]PUT43848.1 hypothetical protein DB743_09615 [Legionella taurinensis]PUT47104.1 hypothetical protein DB745_08745 [Legionella taurinensis]
MRNGNLKIISSSLSVTSPSIISSYDQKTSEFIQKRFYALSTSHHSVLITGSSLAHQHKDIENEQVLDAGAMTFVKNKAGIITGIRQATADGLGGSPDDEMENASIATIASFACETFIDSRQSSLDTYYQIAQSSKDHALSPNPYQTYDSQCALAAAAFSYTGKGKYQGELSNMGDTLLVVLSDDMRVKKILPARHIYRGMGVWTPASVQMLDRKKPQVLINESYEAQEGDVIISMTDGIWSELDLSPFTEKNDVRELKVAEDKFEALFKSASLPKHCSAYEIAATLLNLAVERSLSKRNHLLSVLTQLKKMDLPSKNATVDEVLTALKEDGQEKTAAALSELLFNNNGDGVVYRRGVDIPFAIVLQDLQGRTAGDCSTVNVTRIPYHNDECIRALLNNPKQAAALLRELMSDMPSAEQIKESIARLKQEIVPVKSQMLLEKLETEKNLNDTQLEALEQVLLIICQIKTIQKNTRHYLEQLQQITGLMGTLNESVKGCVMQLIKEDLSPGFTVMKLFTNKETSAFKKFVKAQGPGIALEDFLQALEHDPVDGAVPITISLD